MNHGKHVPPNWMIEMSLAIFAVAILIMGAISVVKRLRGKSSKSTSRGLKSKAGRRRRKGRR